MMMATAYRSILLMLVAATAMAGRVPATAVDHDDHIVRDDPTFLASWMNNLWPAGLDNLTILDLSLPGTHDSLTSELSRTFSDRAEDLPVPISWLPVMIL